MKALSKAHKILRELIKSVPFYNHCIGSRQSKPGQSINELSAEKREILADLKSDEIKNDSYGYFGP